MKSFDVEDVMAALTEVPDNELVILLRKYSCTNNLVIFYFVFALMCVWLCMGLSNM